MPDFHPDVLDSLGRSPREFGWLQLHCEPMVRVGDRVLATLWLQAAFEPAGNATVRIVWATPDGDVASHHLPVPKMAPGAALRWTVELALPSGIEEVSVAVEAPLLEKSQRVRTAWKLLETVELRVETGKAPEGMATVAMLGALTFSSPLLAGVMALATQQASKESSVRRHPPAASSDHVIVPVRQLDGEPPVPGVETIWLPGRPMPAPVSAAIPSPPPPRPPAAAAVIPRCPACRCELSDFDSRMGCCPGCGGEI